MNGAVTTIDPTTGNQLERIARIESGEIERRLRMARSAFEGWRLTPVAQRSKLLASVANQLREQRDTLALVAVREMGKPLTQARAEIDKCAWTCDYFAEKAEVMLADVAIVSDATKSFVAYRPLGPILAIMPWNFPYWQVFRAAIPAVLAGNSVLLKHADNTTRCGIEIEGVFRDAGAPEGLFSTLVISHDEAANIIANDTVVGATLTGSERAGVAIATAAGMHLKKTVLELGGSDPFIVLADADIDAAAKLAVTARFQNNGQSCIAAKRFIVESAVHDAFLEAFVAHAKMQAIGNPLDEKTEIGPIARADLLQSLHEQVRATIDAGARAALGGHPINGRGNFYEPTIVADVKPGMRMFDEETFGPAAAVVRATDATDAVRLANASHYGLGASIHTSDLERAQVLARNLESGMVFINGIVKSDARLPFGGVKRSGYGRELSAFGVHEFTNIQTVWIGG
jgi:acyl-CoA reductase-like NAD-dependent aldehyde dehydrogenase